VSRANRLDSASCLCRGEGVDAVIYILQHAACPVSNSSDPRDAEEMP